MANFDYTAKDKTGVFRKGTVYAADRSEAVANLNENDLTPILIKEQGQKKVSKLKIFSKFSNKVKVNDKVIFTRQFATMINAGIPIAKSLSILSEQTDSKNLKKIIVAINKKVEGGDTLSNALAEHTNVFPPVYVNAIRAGEAGGILDQVLDKLAIQQEKDADLIGKIRGAMIYPAVITTVTVGAFFFLMTVIVPKMASMFENMGTKLPIYTRIMLGISKFISHYILIIIIAIVALVVVLLRYIRSKKGKRVYDEFMLRAPIIGPVIIKMNVARFARTFGSLMASGLGILDAISTTAASLTNSKFQDELRQIGVEVKGGKPISKELQKSRNFPPIVAQMLAVGEETGQMDVILFKLADFYEREVDNVVGNITSLIEPIIILVLGGMIGAIAISVFGPLASLSNAI